MEVVLHDSSDDVGEATEGEFDANEIFSGKIRPVCQGQEVSQAVAVAE